MTRRKRAFVWTAAIIALLYVGYKSVEMVATSTVWGRTRLLAFGLGKANHALGGRGRLAVGTLEAIDGGTLRALNVSLFDTAGVAVVHANEVRGSLRIGALFDKVVHIDWLELTGVRLDLRRDFTGPFNLAHIISGGPKSALPSLPGYSDNIRVDSLVLVDAQINAQYPWAPHRIFTGAARDSIIALRDSLHDIVRLPQGLFLERRRVTLSQVVAHDVVLTLPNHQQSSARIDKLTGAVSDPPVRIVSASGNVTWTPDSLRLDLPALALPASAGSAQGRVAWDQPGPVRFDVTVNAKASLSDLTWVWDVLPTSGGGKAVVRMRTLTNPDDTEYALSTLDVSSMNSHIMGGLTVIVRPADLLLQGVNLSFAPIRSELLRRLSYDAVPASVKGTLRGRLVAAQGGPLKAFRVDLLDAAFDDDQVAGAHSSLRASGLFAFGAEPSARGVRLQDVSMDLRSLKPLAPTMPPIDGMLTGSATVTSGDLRQADVTDIALRWTDAVGHVSNVSGSVQAQFGRTVPTINAALSLDPMVLEAIARIDSTFPLLAPVYGNVTAIGPLDTLKWTAAIANGKGKLNASGTASVTGNDWRIDGQSEVAGFNAHEWLLRKGVYATALNGSVAFGARLGLGADSVMQLRAATFGLSLTQTAEPDKPGFTLLANGLFDAVRIRVDSAVGKMGGVLFEAHGALARDSAGSDTLSINMRADTLGLVRPELLRLAAMLAPSDSSSASTLRSYASDTLDGSVSGSVVLAGSVPAFTATASLGGNGMRVGRLSLGLVLGSLQADGLPHAPHFKASAFVDSIAGLGRLELASADFEILDAHPASGGLSANVYARDSSALNIRGGYTRERDSLNVHLDSLRFNYHDVRWANERPAFLTSTDRTLRLDSLRVQSNKGGVLSLNGDIPLTGPVSATLHVERFPAGEAVAFGLGTSHLSGLLTGDTKLAGTRDAPLLSWHFVAESVGTVDFVLPVMTTDGTYANRELTAQARLADTSNHALRAEARLPMDLALHTVPKRLLSDVVNGLVAADSVHLNMLPIRFQGVSGLQGVLTGEFRMSGSMDHPIAKGDLLLDGFSAFIEQLGITPSGGRLALRGAPDSLIVSQFRFRSGENATDTVSATGAVFFPKDAATRVKLAVIANNAALSRQRDGTEVDLSGFVNAEGPLKRPNVSGSLVVPRASIILDPLGAREALDLNSDMARDVLGELQVPSVENAARALENLGRFANVSRSTVRLGNEVWVRTPESAVKVSGELAINTTEEGLLGLDGELTANRGVFRMDLGPVSRNFTIDSGRVRFYGGDTSATRFNIYATHVVRVAGGGETPVHVVLAGSKDKPTITLSSDDEVYSGAPESEVISLLMFGAPTFALDGQTQSTVRAVASVLVPSLGGKVEGSLQRLLPFNFNTVQVNVASGQEVGDFSRVQSLGASLLDNLSISAGKQLGERTFLRINTGVCRGSAQTSNRSVSLWGGLAAEYRVATGLLAQVGVDPGSAPCSRLGGDTGPRMQFGFDLFREWIF